VRRHRNLLLLLLLALPLGYGAWAWLRFPTDKTPAGAYLRVVTAVNKGNPALAFAYIETTAQHACYTIRDMRRRAVVLIKRDYPEPERSRALAMYRAEAEAADGSDIFAAYARQRGWFDRLRRDVSGIKSVQIEGERATVVTVKGTRYPFRRRPNGIWGLTLFTPVLSSEAERASRDLGLIEQAAADYRRVLDRKSAGVSR